MNEGLEASDVADIRTKKIEMTLAPVRRTKGNRAGNQGGSREGKKQTKKQ